ncbi:MAG: MerR family transcriptional regulator [Alphaproteobacteria bacterium]|nr:MerR family transcriptional regulator [Alphaproteobacteria bacterium]
MNIGEAARLSGVNAKAIRYYESIGLLPPAERTESGYRQYSQADIERLRLIGRARRLGFSIEDVRRLVHLFGSGEGGKGDVKSVVLHHVAEIDRKISELSSIRHSLMEMVNRSEHEDVEGELLERLGQTAVALGDGDRKRTPG